MHVADFLQKRL